VGIKDGLQALSCTWWPAAYLEGAASNPSGGGCKMEAAAKAAGACVLLHMGGM
jgi:hypothetical protein